MKKTLLFLSLGLFSLLAKAQTKSTGVVNLLTGMTAKLDLDNTASKATLTFTGPSDRWFALQFGSFASGQGMQSGQDVVYFNGTTLVDAVHNGIGIPPTTDAVNDWTVTSNTIATGIRTIVATRALSTGSSEDYTFVYGDSSIDFAFSRMSSASFTLAYHGGTNRGYAIDVPLTSVLGIDEVAPAKRFALYPNPANKTISIESKDNIKSVVIYDANGKRITQFVNKKELLDISALQTGLYFVEIENTNDQISIERLIKE